MGAITLLCVAAAYASGYAAEPVFESRVLYAPGHFGNSYEVMGEREARELLHEAQYWGFNGYCDWFDTVDCADPFGDPHYNLGKALWNRKKTHFKSAQDLGFRCGLCITPNHVFLDQCRPEWRAERGESGRIFGQLICPSIPEARAVILNNYDNLFRDLAQAGVHLRFLSPCPYDYGGCACPACNPWILTFAVLCRDIYEVALRYHPGIEMHFVGWWWSEEEHRLFADWADAKAPAWVKSISLHIPYGKMDVSGVPLPAGCERRAFVHIGYADQAQPRDCYGHLGPVIAAERLPKTLRALKAHGVTGFMAYSEGIYEDVNKALVAGIASAQYDDAGAVLRAYARRYFQADETRAGQWEAWLRPWGAPFTVDAAAALQALPAGKDPQHWRFRQWALKAQMLTVHHRIEGGNTWTPARVAAAERFWALRETLERQVYGLGPLRHILDKHFAPLSWQHSWTEHRAQASLSLHPHM